MKQKWTDREYQYFTKSVKIKKQESIGGVLFWIILFGVSLGGLLF